MKLAKLKKTRLISEDLMLILFLGIGFAPLPPIIPLFSICPLICYSEKTKFILREEPKRYIIRKYLYYLAGIHVTVTPALTLIALT